MVAAAGVWYTGIEDNREPSSAGLAFFFIPVLVGLCVNSYVYSVFVRVPGEFPETSIFVLFFSTDPDCVAC